MSDSAVLYIDPDAETRESVAAHLREHLPYTVTAGGSIAEATEAFGSRPIECVVTEYHLPDGTGLELIDWVRGTAPDTACVLYTGVARGEIDTAAFAGALTEYIDRSAAGAVERLADLIHMTTELRSHTAYPLPDNESARLAALTRIDLDSEGLRAAVRRLTELARIHFDVPIASVNVIADHEQEFLVCHGADWERTAREDSICTYAILEDDLTVIEDVHEDLRFADNETIRELGIRFYAGAPLRIDGETPIGTFCIYDHEPRTFDRSDRDYLRLIADEAVDQLELRRGDDPERERQVPSSGEEDR